MESIEDKSKTIDVIQKRSLEALAEQHEKTKNYTNLIMLGGYASAFTLWTNVSDSLDRTTNLYVCLCLCISVFSFVFWEIIKMIYYHISIQKRNNFIMNPPKIEEYMVKFNDINLSIEREKLIIDRFWLIFFVISITTGLGATIILIQDVFNQLFVYN